MKTEDKLQNKVMSELFKFIELIGERRIALEGNVKCLEDRVKDLEERMKHNEDIIATLKHSLRHI